MPTCTDGCGVVAFELPLSTIAAMYARIPEELPRQFAAMRAHPELVRGDGDLDTELMRALPGVVAKGGAEALASVGVAGEDLGIAVRVEDGGYRAIDPVLIETLRQVLGWDVGPRGAPAVRRARHPQLRRRPGGPPHGPGGAHYPRRVDVPSRE